jgi:hypothetical protein
MIIFINIDKIIFINTTVIDLSICYMNVGSFPRGGGGGGGVSCMVLLCIT